MFDLPNATPFDAEPVAAHELVVEQSSGSGWSHLGLTPDVRMVCGGTAYIVSADALAGDPPPPWQGSVAHADRRVGATRGAVSL